MVVVFPIAQNIFTYGSTRKLANSASGFFFPCEKGGLTKEELNLDCKGMFNRATAENVPLR